MSAQSKVWRSRPTCSRCARPSAWSSWAPFIDAMPGGTIPMKSGGVADAGRCARSLASTGAARTAHIRTLASPTPNRVIAARTIQRRPLALAAMAMVAVEALIALLGGHVPVLAALVLLVAPGLALIPLLPARARADLV